MVVWATWMMPTPTTCSSPLPISRTRDCARSSRSAPTGRSAPWSRRSPKSPRPSASRLANPRWSSLARSFPFSPPTRNTSAALWPRDRSCSSMAPSIRKTAASPIARSAATSCIRPCFANRRGRSNDRDHQGSNRGRKRHILEKPLGGFQRTHETPSSRIDERGS
ncbi:unknown [Sinorhizobium phage PBC5]|nr:unknown [Sinorhizobium phage PBC5]